MPRRSFRRALPWTPLLEVLAPETCVLCGRPRDTDVWCPRGDRVRGLRCWDEPHLCRPCAADLATGPFAARAGRGEEALTVWAATATTDALTRALGAWKYEGLRGLAWPLAALLAAGLAQPAVPLRGAVLVPVPLHRGRRRDRGFNQSAVLARLAAGRDGPPVRTDLLRRTAATAQQASLTDPQARAANVAAAFAAPSGPRTGSVGRRPALLVDDVVTTGATVRAAAAALRASGREVAGVLALAAARVGLAGGRVDRPPHPV